MKPTVSVILTTYNAKERLRNALESYRYQTYPTDRFEVVIVDDGSEDGTQAWFEESNWNFPVKYLYNRPNKGRAGARNVGIHAASGDVIIFSDCDMIVDSDFIKRHADYHRKSENVVVCGSFWQSVYSHLYRDFDHFTWGLIKGLVNHDSNLKNRYASLDALPQQNFVHLLWKKEVKDIRQSPLIFNDTHISKFFDQYAKGDYYFNWIFFVVMNVSVRKKHLVLIGGFDEKFHGYGCEDTDVGYRLWKRGLQFVVDPDLKNYHQEHLRNNEKQEAERIRNLKYMVKKHKAADMALFDCVSVGSKHRKSAFMFARDRLLSKGIISKPFVSQLNGLIWKCAQEKYPEIGDASQQFDNLDGSLFWAELEKVRGIPEYAPFVKYVKRLYEKTRDHNGL